MTMAIKSTLKPFHPAFQLALTSGMSLLLIILRNLVAKKSKLAISKLRQRSSNLCMEIPDFTSGIRGLRRIWLSVLNGENSSKSSKLQHSMSYFPFQKKLLNPAHLSGSLEWCDYNCALFDLSVWIRSEILIDWYKESRLLIKLSKLPLNADTTSVR